MNKRFSFSMLAAWAGLAQAHDGHGLPGASHWHAGDVALLLHNLGVVNHKLGNLDQATNMFMRALAIREKLYGMSAPAVAETLEALSITLKDAGDLDAAAGYRQRAKIIREEKP